MATTRSAIEAIQERLTGELLELALREEEVGPDEASLAFTNLTSAAVWEALYTLANHVDELRR